MTCYRRRQSGAVLLLVMGMLMVGSLMALAAMQSALVDERLAGNLVAMTRARMAAEAGASERLIAGPERTASQDCAEVEQALAEGDRSLLGEWQVVIAQRPRVGYYAGSCWWHGALGQWVLGWAGNDEQRAARHLVLLLPEADFSTLLVPSESPSVVWWDRSLGD